jgi:hypothetical protein
MQNSTVNPQLTPQPTSLYGLGAYPTENTVSNSSSIVFVGGGLAMAWISFLWECIYRAVAQKRLFVYLPIA